MALFALIGPALVGIDSSQQNLSATLAAPNPTHWLGTDAYGRSVLARLAHAAQLSIGLALLCTLSAAVPGAALGMLAAWRGRALERALVLLADGVLALPGLLLVLLLFALAPGRIWTLYVGLSLAFWVEYFRVVRAASHTVLASDAVQASRLLGFQAGYIARRHLLPELAPVLGAMLVLTCAQAVLAVAALGFINVGVPPPTPELGSMLIEYLPHYEEAPWLIAAPVSLLMLFVLGLMLLASESDSD